MVTHDFFLEIENKLGIIRDGDNLAVRKNVIIEKIGKLQDAAEQTVVADRATWCACGNAISPSNQCEGCAGLV